MQLKFENKSQRIKGLSFHPIRPWILAALHNGAVQLWDYRIQSLVEQFEAHEGPCRGVSFHKTQPLFVSGGDDYLIKVWNYKQRKHLFTLKGHLDYIRTVEFHNELPWILSSSDDQTIRIWNQQNRCLLAILTGHSHYVMSAQFHPSKDLIVSCSLDQSVRLWDYSAIRNKYNNYKSTSKGEIYGTEVETVAVMDGHDLGVNWCAFHPTLNLIISAADDRKIKLWKYTESKAWETDSFYGHSSNVSCCIFIPKLDYIVSNSEDKTTRVWSLDRRIQLDQTKKETDRFWILAAHPEAPIFASGHDNGFEIYSLESAKIPFTQLDSNVIAFAHEKKLRVYDQRQKSALDCRSLDLQNSASSTQNQLGLENVVSVVHNPFDTQKAQILVGIQEKDKEMGKYLLLQYDSMHIHAAKEQTQGFFSFGTSGAVFVSKTKIARIRENKEVEVHNIDLDSSSNALPQLANVSKLFQAPIGKLLAIVADEGLVLYDVNMKKTLNTVSLASSEQSAIKGIFWNKTNTCFALVCKKTIHIFTKNLVKVCSFTENFNIKSAFWTKDNSLIYSTINHIKFGLLNGDVGVLKCTDQTLRVVKMEKNELLVIDSQASFHTLKLNCEEYLLKLALQERNWEKTQKIMGSMQQLGNSVVSYLYKKNYPGLALNLVQDKRAQFSLALDSGNLQVAYDAAKELKEKELYKKFSLEALRQGQLQDYEGQPSVEMAYRNTKEYEKLSLLYLVVGRSARLKAMINVANKRGDNQSRFQNSLYVGDVEERIRVLSEIGQLNLAYLTAVTHGKTEMAETLKNSLENPDEVLKELENLKQSALVPPTPLVKDISTSKQAQRNWPLNHIPEEYIVESKHSQDAKVDELVEESNQNRLLVDEDELQEGGDGNDETQQQAMQDNFERNEEDIDGGWDLGEEEAQVVPQQQQVQQQSQPSSQKQDIYKRHEHPVLAAGRLSQSVGEQTAVGVFEAAFQTMKKQLGIVNFEPLKEVAMKVSTYSQICVPQLPFLQNQMQFIINEKGNNRPYVFMNLQYLSQMVQRAYKEFEKGPQHFKTTLATFTEILHSVPFVDLNSQDELNSVKKLIKICLEYTMAIKFQLTSSQQPKRASELIAYMAMCNLQNPHKIITQRQAQSSLFKEKNYIYSSYFAKKLIRMLENTDKQTIVNNAKNILATCEKEGTNTSKLTLEESYLYDDDFILQVDAESLTIISGNSTKCPFCSARYEREKEGNICSLCGVAKIGQEVLGLKVV